MKKTIISIIFLAISISSFAEVFNVRSFGAAGDGISVDTPAINDAISAASTKGGGTIYIPAGKYLCYSIRLRSNICLYLEPGATIIAAKPVDGMGYDNPEPAINDKYQGFGHNHVCNSLIWGIGLENVTICGGGKIDGTNLDSWTEYGPGHGNKAIGLKDCRLVTIRDIIIYRGGHFAVHATAVDNFVIDAIKVDSDRDGIDIICCKGVSISNCFVNTPEDDSIALKSNNAMGYSRDVENVSITNCHISGYKCGTLLNGKRERFDSNYDEYRSGGRIKLGTESSGGYKNISVSNCTFDYCGGILLQSMDGGHMEDVSINNIVMRDGLYCPIFIRLGARMRSPEGTPVGRIRRINISNLIAYNAESWTSCIISGIPGHFVEDVNLSNIQIWYKGGFSADDGKITPPEFEKDYPEPWMFGTIPSKGFFLRHAKDITFDNVSFRFEKEDGRPLFVQTDTERVMFYNIKDNGKSQ